MRMVGGRILLFWCGSEECFDPMEQANEFYGTIVV